MPPPSTALPATLSPANLLTSLINQLDLATNNPSSSTSFSSNGGGGISSKNTTSNNTTPASVTALHAKSPPHVRQLIVLAHCLLPTTFLSALDLLDKGLVTRVKIKNEAEEGQDEDIDHSVMVDVSKQHHDIAQDIQSSSKQITTQRRTRQLYYVRSAPVSGNTGSTSYNNAVKSELGGRESGSGAAGAGPGGGGAGGGGGGKRQQTQTNYLYEVRPDIWHCTCVAFTFSLYHSGGFSTQDEGDRQVHGHDGQSDDSAIEDEDQYEETGKGGGYGSGNDGDNDQSDEGHRAGKHAQDVKEERQDEEYVQQKEHDGLSDVMQEKRRRKAKRRDKWRWGGRTGRRLNNPPICKHLIACVLAERCSGLVRNLVVEREMTVEEQVELSVLWE